MPAGTAAARALPVTLPPLHPPPQFKRPDQGGVSSHIAERSPRSSNGSLVLGQLQECYGGCFSPQYALRGDMAQLRVWNRVLTK